MRVLLLIVAVWLSTVSGAIAQDMGWEASRYPDETSAASIGCAPLYSDENFTCLVVRCEPAGELALYSEMSGLGGQFGDWTLRVDELSFSVNGTATSGEAPYDARLSGPIAEIIAALSHGRMALVVFSPEMALKPGADTIPLKGSSREIARVEAACGGPAPTTPPAEAGRESWMFQAPSEHAPHYTALVNDASGIYALSIVCDPAAGGAISVSVPAQNYDADYGSPAPASTFAFAVDDGQPISQAFGPERDC